MLANTNPFEARKKPAGRPWHKPRAYQLGLE